MKKTIIAFLLVLTVAAVLFLWLLRTTETLPIPTPKPVAVEEVTPADPRADAVRDAADDRLSYEKRMKALHALENQALTAGQVSSVHTLMQNRQAPPPLRNDAFELLLKQNHSPALMSDLIGGWEDTAENHLWRDFALQHMVPAYDTAGESGRKAAVATLKKAAAAGDGNHAGTAILSLNRLAAQHPELAADAAAARHAAIAAPEANPEAFGTALATAGESSDRSALVAAKTQMNNESLPIRVRMSCIAAIGQLGGREELALLETLSTHGEKRLARAGELQAQALRKRLSTVAESARR